MDRDFTEESVKRFLIDRGGRVKNSELVTRFRNFLNDSARKGKCKHFTIFRDSGEIHEVLWTIDR